MTSTLRKIALQVTIPVLCGLVVLNAYIAAKNLRLIQDNANRGREALDMQAEISSVVLDLQDMETGQRGYLLTGDPSYLQPYHDAKARLSAHFGHLRSRLTGQDHSLETHLESVAEEKIAEMEETIQLRERGYRHRAFVIVSSNRGKDLMSEARTTANALSSAQTRNITRYGREVKESVAKALQQSALASGLLLVFSVGSFLAFNTYRKRLEVACARHSEELQGTSLQLERLTSIIFHDVRALLGQIRDNANSLIDVYGGFLPHQGQQKIEQIEDGAGQMIRLLDESAKNLPSENSVEAVATIDDRPLQELSA